MNKFSVITRIASYMSNVQIKDIYPWSIRFSMLFKLFILLLLEWDTDDVVKWLQTQGLNAFMGGF